MADESGPVYIEYTVPVLVEMDPESGHISAVYRYSEDIEATGKVFAADRVTELPAAETSTLLDLADSTDQVWPVWEEAN